MHIIRSHRVLTPSGIRPADVLIANGCIAEIAEHGALGPPGSVTDYGEAMVSPGLIDVHCHINEPGRAHWEGFRTATRAAAAGGVTLLCDMPLNSDPVTTSCAALESKIAAASDKLQVDVSFYGGVIPQNAGNAQALAELSRGGVRAFKCFLCDSGLDSFPAVARADLLAAMPTIKKLGKRLLVHAELFDCATTPPRPPASYQDALRARPAQVEVAAIELLAEVCESTGCAVHIVHLSAAAALPRLAALKAAGLPITVETCPHYLTFCAEGLTLDPTFKCTPPMRNRDNREALWQGLEDGTIDFIATDHSPCPPELKFSDDKELQAGQLWQRAWGGIASLQLLLPAVWTQARARGHSLERVSQWLAERPAAWLGEPDRGAIAVGRRADLVIWHPERSFEVEGTELEHRHPTTPYEGVALDGVVQSTLLHGDVVYDAKSIEPFAAASGRPIRSRHGQLMSTDPAALKALNELSGASFRAKLSACCGAQVWVASMTAQRPFQSAGDLALASERAFDGLTGDDWRQAFDAHPRIGDLSSLREKYAASKDLAGAEQAGTAIATEETLNALATANAKYDRKFGQVFLICASGRSAESMLSDLERRLENEAATEFAIATEEQRKITFLRLQSLLA